MKQFPSAALPPLWTRCGNPASITSASSPSPSPIARALNKHDYRRRQSARPEPPAIPHLFNHHAHERRLGDCRFGLYSISRESLGGIGGELGGTKVSLVSAAGIPMPKETVVTESKAVDPTK